MSGGMTPLLGFRSHFSLGESVLTPDAIVKAALDAKVSTVAVCDTMTVSSMIELTKAADKKGVRAIVGVRLRVVDHLIREKGSNKDAAFIKAFTQNEEGMKAIYKLLSVAFDPDHFYEAPRLTWDDFARIDPSNLIWTTGDLDGIFGQPTGSQSRLSWMVANFGEENIFAELIPVNTPFFDRFNAEAILACKRSGIEPLLSYPALYNEGGYEPFLCSMAIQRRSDLRKAFTVQAPHNTDAHPIDMKEAILRMGEAKARINARYSLDQGDLWKRPAVNTQRFGSICAYKWTKQTVSLPSLSATPDNALIAMCKDGLVKRLYTDVNGFQPTPEQIREEYLPRLKYELGVLRDLKFADYFLVVSHVVNWSKEQGILVGPGRGSVGGSLVAFLIGITDVDPIRFGLLFERFINPSRNDLPDADLDFMSTRRGEVVAHIEEYFGTDKVAGISNYGELGGSSALRDVGRLYGKNVMDMEIAKFVPKVFGASVALERAAEEVPAIRKWADLNPEIWKNAVILGGGLMKDGKTTKDGILRSYGKHAAGVIVSGVPLTERCVVEQREGAKVANWNMTVAEDAGLVKLDILGLSTLDTLKRCQDYIWQRHTKKVDLSKIPLDDPKTLALFGEGKTQGVFQFEGGAARRLLKDLAKTTPLTFDDLVAANALNRPGPIEAGLVKQYVDAKNDEGKPVLAHPNMAGALEPTFNVLCYQEQVMRVSVDLCGFNLSEADKLRKAMGKKDAALMASFRDKFCDGAFSHSGMDKAEAGEVFDVIQGFAGYAFNKSHAVEYSLIAYQVAYLKAHYPVEFFAAALSTVNEDKLQPLVEESVKLGIEIMPPDVNISTNDFVIATDTKLYIPFNRVKGISDKVGDAIIAGRQMNDYPVIEKVKVGRKAVQRTVFKVCTYGRFDSPEDFRARIAPKNCNARAVESLTKVGAFCSIDPAALPPLHEDRRRDQHELLPNLTSHPVVVSRYIVPDKYSLIEINNIFRDLDLAFPKVTNVRPLFGKTARFMVVFDAPNRFEEGAKKFTEADTFDAVKDSLFHAGMGRNDAYWTGLVKRTKEGSTLPYSMISDYAPYFERELSILKPPLILALGTNAAKYLVPDIAKGSIFDHIGKVFYDRRRDCNILIGFTPGMVHYDPDKQPLLNDLFERAGSMVL